jgi:hypothetical protein
MGLKQGINAYSRTGKKNFGGMKEEGSKKQRKRTSRKRSTTKSEKRTSTLTRAPRPLLLLGFPIIQIDIHKLSLARTVFARYTSLLWA